MKTGEKAQNWEKKQRATVNICHVETLPNGAGHWQRGGVPVLHTAHA